MRFEEQKKEASHDLRERERNIEGKRGWRWEKGRWRKEKRKGDREREKGERSIVYYRKYSIV